ncbi:hypothetical protein TEA_004764 [Camellia sinensis var. sinensis]|uniref:Uncharacterized protein n=1 Tax=Camellia sinensis var. sinensis TaxID=542762 RepID=A0A4S4EFI7_CAMSN|nr:hypothetical protein TEA_004764 [Camellia sinensis var. sinensis]
MEFRPRNYTAEEATYSLPRSHADTHPLSTPSPSHHQVDVVDHEKDDFYDPLRGSDANGKFSIDNLQDEENSSAVSKADVGLPEKEWISFKKLLMQRFSGPKMVSISKMSDVIVKSGKVHEKTSTTMPLEELDDPQKFAEDGIKVISQQEYVSCLHELKDEIARAWQADDRVTSLKVSIKVARLLTDTSVLQFYPTLFVLATDVMDMLGNMVWQRIKQKAEFAEDGNVIRSLPENFDEKYICLDAKETCSNWFFKIGSIRELLPRIYLELAILPCWRFLLNRPMDVLERLVMMTRGIADPLASAYCRLYLAHCAQKLSQHNTRYLIVCISDMEILLTRFLSEKEATHEKFSENCRSLVSLTEPAIEYIIKCIIKESYQTRADEVLMDLGLGRKQPCVSIILHHLLKELPSELVGSNALEILQLIECSKDYSFDQQFNLYNMQCLNYRLLGFRLSERSQLDIINAVVDKIIQVVSAYSNLDEYLKVIDAYVDIVLQNQMTHFIEILDMMHGSSRSMVNMHILNIATRDGHRQWSFRHGLSSELGVGGREDDKVEGTAGTRGCLVPKEVGDHEEDRIFESRNVNDEGRSRGDIVCIKHGRYRLGEDSLEGDGLMGDIGPRPVLGLPHESNKKQIGGDEGINLGSNCNHNLGQVSNHVGDGTLGHKSHTHILRCDGLNPDHLGNFVPGSKQGLCRVRQTMGISDGENDRTQTTNQRGDGSYGSDSRKLQGVEFATRQFLQIGRPIGVDGVDEADNDDALEIFPDVDRMINEVDVGICDPQGVLQALEGYGSHESSDESLGPNEEVAACTEEERVDDFDPNLNRLFHEEEETLVHSSNCLAVKAMKDGQKHLSFVKSCIAYSEVTIPSVPSRVRQFILYLETAEIALLGGLVSHSDGLLDSAIICLQTLDLMDGSRLPNEVDGILSLIRKLCSLLVLVPDAGISSGFSSFKVFIFDIQSEVSALFVSLPPLLSAVNSKFNPRDKGSNCQDGSIYFYNVRQCKYKLEEVSNELNLAQSTNHHRTRFLILSSYTLSDVVFPIEGNPERGVTYIPRMTSRMRTMVLCAIVSLAATLSQFKLPYHANHVEMLGNDHLFFGDPTYLQEFLSLSALILQNLVDFIMQEPSRVARGSMALEACNCIASSFNPSHEVLPFFSKLMETAKSCLSSNDKYLHSTIKCNAKFLQTST